MSPAVASAAPRLAARAPTHDAEKQRARRKEDATARVIKRWHGLGALLAAAFYSLFFSAHLKFQDTPIYIRDGILFGAQTHSVFQDLTTERSGDHSRISTLHPAFTLIHQPATQLLTKGWELLGRPRVEASRHGVATLTCLAGALAVVMVYHTLLWAGLPGLRAVLLAAAFGAGTCAWIMAPLPETWLFAGTGAAAMAAVTARGNLARPVWHLLAAVYAISCFIGNLIPCLILALTRCAQDRTQFGSFHARPLLTVLGAITLTFALANVQRQLYPHSAPLPRSWQDVLALRSDWHASAETAPLLAREIFVSNIVAPAEFTAVPDKSRSRIVLNEARWSSLGLQHGLSAGWLLLLALALAGIVWRAQMDPLALGLISALAWSVLTVSWYGSEDRLLVHASQWTPLVVVLAGLGLERALQHWRFIATPVTLFLAVFVCALITRNWLFINEIAAIPGR
ncbi:MAG: hypothetical protein LDL31_06040 [Prosthecobacter sp.]|nr:hypothetical protein [Prosthecobacter sp.]